MYDELLKKILKTLEEHSLIEDAVITWKEPYYGEDIIVKEVTPQDREHVAQSILDAIWPDIEENKLINKTRQEYNLRRSYSGDPDPGGTTMLGKLLKEHNEEG